jgi:hypothetical protein
VNEKKEALMRKVKIGKEKEKGFPMRRKSLLFFVQLPKESKTIPLNIQVQVKFILKIP